MTESFKRHGFVVILSLIVGALCIAPHLYARYAVPSYVGIHLTGSDSEEHYESRIQEVRDGFSSVGNTYGSDKTVPAIMPALAENIMAFLANIFHLPTADFAEYSKFAFPFIAAICMYAFGYFLLRSRAAALLGAAMVLLGDNLISGPAAWKAFFTGGAYVSGFLTYSRPINPEFTGILLAISLLLVVRAFFSERTPLWYEGVGIGVIVGIAFYPSPYVASFVASLVAAVGVVSIYGREWQRVFAALSVGITVLICLIPFILDYVEVVGNPLYQEAAARVGVSTSHTPVFGAWIMMMLFAAIFAIPRQFRQARLFFLYSGIALMLLLNQQIITGHVLVSEHYHWYITKPLISFLIGMYVVAGTLWLFQKRPYLRFGVYGLVVGILILNAIQVQTISLRAQLPTFIESQRYAPVFAYLKMAPERELIWANYAISELIPIYTSHDTANNRQMQNYLVPTKYLEDELYFQYRLRGVPTKDAPELMQKERYDVSATVYGIRWRQTLGGYENIPEPLLLMEIQNYQKLSDVTTYDLAKKMGITVLIWDKEAEPSWHMQEFPEKKELFQANNIVVYRIGTSTTLW